MFCLGVVPVAIDSFTGCLRSPLPSRPGANNKISRKLMVKTHDEIDAMIIKAQASQVNLLSFPSVASAFPRESFPFLSDELVVSPPAANIDFHASERIKHTRKGSRRQNVKTKHKCEHKTPTQNR